MLGRILKIRYIKKAIAFSYMQITPSYVNSFVKATEKEDVSSICTLVCKHPDLVRYPKARDWLDEAYTILLQRDRRVNVGLPLILYQAVKGSDLPDRKEILCNFAIMSVVDNLYRSGYRRYS
ncbi:MAG TPA: hypothetical protein VFF28_03930 [Candidatus Nanoarchaeia archaeon]|nr:hypothetical protein [Candidatus Nanoarchaeia archaeon]